MKNRILFIVLSIIIGHTSFSQSVKKLFVPDGIIYESTGNNIGIGTNAPRSILDIIDSSGGAHLSIQAVGSDHGYQLQGIKLGAYSQVYSINGGDSSFAESLLNETRFLSTKFQFGSEGGGDDETKFNFFGLAWIDRLKIGDESSIDGKILDPLYQLGVYGKSAFNDYVGINTVCLPEDTAVKLGVKGKVLCEGMKVKLAGDDCWADFVFDDKYNLRPLSEVKKFIEKNKHLPEIPSAAEITENGLSVEEMLKLQMQKIEELTLYTIQLQEKLEQSNKNFENLSKQVNKMKQGK